MRSINCFAFCLHLPGLLLILAACRVDGYYVFPDADDDDAAPSRPIVENGQRADLVLGQELFTTADQNHGGLSARSLRFPVGVTVDVDGRLWVLDSGNFRALMWSPAPPASFAPAVLVTGAADFATTGWHGATPPPAGVSCPLHPQLFTARIQLAAAAGKLLIPYALCNRVMIWNPAPTINGTGASTVLGQASFDGTTSGNGAADLDGPTGVWTDGTRVAVADGLNSRVLIWTSFPTTNKQPADIVLGQPGFGTSGSASPPTGATMNYPASVYSDGVRLFVVDGGNHRVLVWRSFPTINGQPADFAIGQTDLTSNEPGHGASQLASPHGITAVGDHLFVADTGNNRVLVFSPIPTASGMAAASVLGQPSFETTGAGATQETLSTPESLVVGGNKLYVTDYSNHRVLRFDLKL